MKLNILLVLLFIVTISLGRRLKFLSEDLNELAEQGLNSNKHDAKRNDDDDENEGIEAKVIEEHSGEENDEGHDENGEEEQENGDRCPTPGYGGEEPFEQETCKGVMFDAGSSGTRVFVYTWPCRLFDYANPEIEITQHAPSTKVNPGISAFGNNVPGLKDYLQPLIDWAGKYVDEKIRARTPILLGATAGMRILEWYQQYEIMEEIQKIFKASGYLFKNSDWARIISGKDEVLSPYNQGAYLWLTVNYLKGAFVSSNIDENENLLQSYTTVDLGGASTQLADDITDSDHYYLSPDNQYETDYHTLDTSIYNISLYSHSWLYYGQDQARILTNQFLSRLHRSSKTYENPCFLKGYKFDLPEGQSVTGSGNSDDCRDLIDLFLHGFNSSCDQCAIQDSYLPRIQANTRLYAGGAVEPAAKILGKQKFTLKDFNVYNDLCQKNYNSANQNKYYPLECFLGLYTQQLLKSGYLVDPQTVIETGDIRGIEPSWTLAAMFDQIDDNEDCDDSPQCNFRRHMKTWKKDRMHPRMKEHKNEQPFKRMIP